MAKAFADWLLRVSTTTNRLGGVNTLLASVGLQDPQFLLQCRIAKACVLVRTAGAMRSMEAQLEESWKAKRKKKKTKEKK